MAANQHHIAISKTGTKVEWFPFLNPQSPKLNIGKLDGHISIENGLFILNCNFDTYFKKCELNEPHTYDIIQ